MAGLMAPEWVMAFVWGPSYQEGAGILRVLFLGAPLVFIVLVGVMLTIVLEREVVLMKVMCAAALFNILANALVIPTWGGIGAAWTTLATEALIAIGILLVLRDSAFTVSLKRSRAGG